MYRPECVLRIIDHSGFGGSNSSLLRVSHHCMDLIEQQFSLAEKTLIPKVCFDIKLKEIIMDNSMRRVFFNPSQNNLLVDCHNTH